MNIFESINKVMSDIGAVGKNSKNAQQGFMFRGIDAVMNAINPALVRNRVFVVPEILEQTREDRVTSKGTNIIYSLCKIKYTFYAEDGTSVSAITIGEGMDTGDKATNKAMAIAFKYALFQVFCIPTEEMKQADPDRETLPDSKPKMPDGVLRGDDLINEAMTKALIEKAGDKLPDVLKLMGVKEAGQIQVKKYTYLINNWDKAMSKIGA